MVSGRFGLFWLVSGRFGWFRVLVSTAIYPTFRNIVIPKKSDILIVNARLFELNL